MTLYPENAEEFNAPKYGLKALPALKLKAISPGGGGWGDPLDRDPVAVQRDVRDGMVSLLAAADNYGVILDSNTLEINQQATRAHRLCLQGEKGSN